MPEPMPVGGGVRHKCHAKPVHHKKTKPKKGNKGRHLKGKKAKGAPAPMSAPGAKRAPVGTKPHRGKPKHGAKHPCA